MLDKIIKEAKRISLPTKIIQKRRDELACMLIKLIKKESKKYQQITGIEFGGSYAKGTWVHKKGDIDIFIKFNVSTSNDEFIRISKNIGFNSLKKFSPYTRYSDHPYVEAIIKQTKVNVVPCYDVMLGNWKSAADRSLFHTKFMLKHLTCKMKDDIKLFKIFLDSNNIYGSEITKQGFSGYITEVLIYNFGNFNNTIKKIASLKKNQVIGNSIKIFNTSISIIDPIDKNRNLAAAVSVENIGKLILLCRAFLKRPSILYFKKEIIKTNNTNIKNTIIIRFNYKSRSQDIIGGQIRKIIRILTRQIENAGFKVIRSTTMIDYKKANLIFLIKDPDIENFFIKEGPSFFCNDDTDKFIQKNKKNSKILWINNEKTLSLHVRKFNNIRLFLIDLLNNNINKIGIPAGLKYDVPNKLEIIRAHMIKNKQIKEIITDLINTDEKIFLSY